MSVTLDSSKLWSRDLIAEELDHLTGRFKGSATVDVRKGLSIVSLICDASRSSEILKQASFSTPDSRFTSACATWALKLPRNLSCATM